jgi:hypothetical protein
MTELPDDMEGRLARIEAAIEQSEVFGFKTTNPAIADLRALLLDYQERGRALEDLLALPVAAQSLVHLDKGIGTKTPEAAWLRARAALKGKSHE